MPISAISLFRARRKLLGASLAATLLLWGALGAHASYLGASGDPYGGTK
jgi:hypothetical protein